MKPYFYCIFLCLLFSCKYTPPRPVSIAFYHWQSTYAEDSLENHYLHTLGVQKIYIKAFDVDWNEQEKQAVPLAELKRNDSLLSKPEYIPTVFITNRTMIHIPPDQVETLGDRMITKILTKWKAFEWDSPTEIQLDCDWSSQSRRNYFHLVDYLRKKYHLKISVTIRLHQYKYPETTGIPPANHGVLMVYNMGDLQDPSEKNSILNLQAAARYLNQDSPYPLKLQVALPLFSWAVVRRRGKVIALIPEVEVDDLRNYTSASDKTHLEITQSHYFKGIYLYQGDLVRLEQVKLEDLKETARLIRKNMAYDSLELCFYHLDRKVLQNFPVKDLQEIQAILRD